MRFIREYKRARSLEEARDLLMPGSAYLAGGTRIVSTKPRDVHTVIDISGLGLDRIAPGSIGATVRLQDLLQAPDTPEMLREALRHHLPATWRNIATAGGECVFGGAASDLLVALLALDARFVVDREEVPFLDYHGGLATEIRYTQPKSAAFVKLSRIKTDRAIVNAAAALLEDGPRLVLGGVGAKPLVVHGTHVPPLDPPGDFRGSAEYRREVAPVLAERALKAAGL